MKNLYLILAILGGIIPYLFFFQFIQLEGVNIPLFIESLFVNGAAAGFSVDLLISSFVFWFFMFQESKVSSNPKPYLYVIINLTIGLSCALPAYLYAKARVKNT
ncbi:MULTISPECIES: DUF2834 domain-containing protein [Pseudoalteromonas]|uniref:DUF2834 domain-containing protein n=1 Tax=Pseudoalteromonas aurantia 208 TaxID=1314867 RepID=A0ABR9EBR8_9GAMM|nr:MULTISPECIES: DUF2834 domain-containing protein [Pseudoalteromonas]MBE0368410.1 hypothetical protein [Pseudoalteromonas aurantia 208]MBQ4848348.1 DUF2834 domain-containing protein [Pseudoalteromonas sp. MMG005]